MDNNLLTIYHGSSEKREHPVFGYGKIKNDYGRGFYCTESLELAKEWACANGDDGYANMYTLDLEGLSVLKLNTPQYHILNWLAILLDNRTFNISGGIGKRAKEYIMEHFLPDYKNYDVIIGYRADDSYFAYASDFIENTLSVENLKRAMELGKLGEQVALISRKAFDALTFIKVIPASGSEYYEKYSLRDTTARKDYRELRDNSLPEEGTYAMDIIRGKWENDDARLQ